MVQNASWPDRILTSTFQFSLLCKEKYQSAKSLLYHKEQLQKIWRSDRGFGSTFRKQKAKRQRRFKFQTQLQKPKPTTSFYWHLLLPNVSLPHIYKRIPDLMPWHFYIRDSALKRPTSPKGTWELAAGCPKAADNEQSWEMIKSQQKASLKWKEGWYTGCHTAVSNIISHWRSVLRVPYRMQFSLTIQRLESSLGNTDGLTERKWEESWSDFSLAKHLSRCLKLTYFFSSDSGRRCKQ